MIKILQELLNIDTSENKLPMIYLRDVSSSELEWLIQFIYSGRCDVPTKHLNSFLQLAKSLRVKGFNDVEESEEAILPHVQAGLKTKEEDKEGVEKKGEDDANGDSVYSVNQPKSPVKRKIRDEVSS